MSYFVYIVRTKNNFLYTGHSNNLNRREFEHLCHHEGAKFIKDAKSKFNIVYTEKFKTRIEAMKREKQIKRWSRKKKEALIESNFSDLKKLSRCKNKKAR